MIPHDGLSLMIDFVQHARSYGFSIERVPERYVLHLKKGDYRFRTRVAYRSSLFKQFSAYDYDLIVCWERDWDPGIPTLIMSEPVWDRLDVEPPTPAQREAADAGRKFRERYPVQWRIAADRVIETLENAARPCSFAEISTQINQGATLVRERVLPMLLASSRVVETNDGLYILGEPEGMPVENEQGVVVSFALQAEDAGFEILHASDRFPDLLVRKNGREYRAEVEYLAKDFRQHRHSVLDCDLLICWRNNSFSDFVLPVLELSQSDWQQTPLDLPTQAEREAFENDPFVMNPRAAGAAESILELLEYVSEKPDASPTAIMKATGRSSSFVRRNISRLTDIGILGRDERGQYIILREPRFSINHRGRLHVE